MLWLLPYVEHIPELANDKSDLEELAKSSADVTSKFKRQTQKAEGDEDGSLKSLVRCSYIIAAKLANDDDKKMVTIENYMPMISAGFELIEN